LVAALDNANPGFLEKILGALFAAGDVDEIAEQAVLILLDQAVKQIGITPLQAARDGFGFIAHQRGERQSGSKNGRGSEKIRWLGSQT
jgi:hypothetical protein